MATAVSGCVKQSVWSLACWSYSSAYISELRLVHTASKPSSLSRVYTVFYWLTAPRRAKDASLMRLSISQSLGRLLLLILIIIFIIIIFIIIIIILPEV